MQVKKHFIAGAVCPQCKNIDKIVIFREADSQIMQCVECHFSQSQSFLASSQNLTASEKNPD